MIEPEIQIGPAVLTNDDRIVVPVSGSLTVDRSSYLPEWPTSCTRTSVDFSLDAFLTLRVEVAFTRRGPGGETEHTAEARRIGGQVDISDPEVLTEAELEQIRDWAFRVYTSIMLNLGRTFRDVVEFTDVRDHMLDAAINLWSGTVPDADA